MFGERERAETQIVMRQTPYEYSLIRFVFECSAPAGGEEVKLPVDIDRPDDVSQHKPIDKVSCRDFDYVGVVFVLARSQPRDSSSE
ncbi:unnamed protein product [Strongylus vulgaris]|uniref:Uncharacterized protein n=1 Tax=Strongylus vulgaris TaxID=40348 RepID=A0A3P7I7G0_STRVU|nr:unnamed protein product [Strongylus vulgaris]